MALILIPETKFIKKEVHQQDNPPEFCREAIQKALDENKGRQQQLYVNQNNRTGLFCRLEVIELTRSTTEIMYL